MGEIQHILQDLIFKLDHLIGELTEIDMSTVNVGTRLSIHDNYFFFVLHHIYFGQYKECSS